MGFFSSFISGAVTGIVGLGLASWLIVSSDKNASSDEADKEEE